MRLSAAWKTSTKHPMTRGFGTSPAQPSIFGIVSAKRPSPLAAPSSPRAEARRTRAQRAQRSPASAGRSSAFRATRWRWREGRCRAVEFRARGCQSGVALGSTSPGVGQQHLTATVRQQKRLRRQKSQGPLTERPLHFLARHERW